MINFCIFAVKLRLYQEMNKPKIDLLFSGVLFSILGLLVWFILANYVGAPKNIMKIFSSPWAGLFIITFSNILGKLIISISIWLNTQYIQNIGKKKKKAVLMHMIIILILLAVNYAILVIAKLLSDTPQPFTFPHGGIHILIMVWFIEVVILGLLLTNRAMGQMLHYQQQAYRMQKENAIARYAVLQNQLNPHFLFNSLNALVVEIECNPQRAVTFTHQLSDVYRYVLQVQKRNLVTLEDELKFTSAYLYLHEVRLGNCIHCDIDISNEQKEYQLPPLTFQILLENIIKHNSISSSQPMEIMIAVVDEWLVVSNTLCPRVSTESTGLGLKNLSNRCQMILEKDIQIVCTKNLFTVKIPLLYE